jgi:carbon storage regulator CsrA
MLCLGRKKNESILIPELGIKIMVVRIKPGGLVEIGIEADKSVKIYREEVWNDIQHFGHREGKR